MGEKVKVLFEILMTSVFFLAGTCYGMSVKETYIDTGILLEGNVTDWILIYGTCAQTGKLSYIYENDIDCLTLILELQLAIDDW